MELTGVPAEWRALRDLGEHHLREAASTPGEQDGGGEHLRLAQRGLGGRHRGGEWSAACEMGAPRVSRRKAERMTQ